MSEDYDESLLEMFIFETSQNIEQLEQIILENERDGGFSEQGIAEIFRIMHTIKGSAAMMEINNLSRLAHSMEDMFSFIRNLGKAPEESSEAIADIVLESIDIFKTELAKIQGGGRSDADETQMCEKIGRLLRSMKKAPTDAPAAEISVKAAEQPAEEKTGSYKNAYKAEFHFEDGCQMESIRACNLVCRISEFSGNVRYFPEDIMDSDDSVAVIREKGVQISFDTNKEYQEICEFFSGTPFVCNLNVEKVNAEQEAAPEPETRVREVQAQKPQHNEGVQNHSSGGSIISVSVTKLDKLMDLLGELVISEAMVIHNPELKGLTLDGFSKAAQQLRKITGEMQDMVMSIRMVELTATFQRMNRIVRDMCKKLNKQVELKIVGEDTQVDKNIIDHIADPLMHLIRNSLDHGIESAEERIAAGKPEIGTITIEARNEGSEVLVCVRDDGKGLNKEKILKRAQENGLLSKPASEMTDKEIYSMIFLPGFSTNDKVTEFSGRGVGMDVVVKNIEAVGGKVSVESVPGKGCLSVMRFPITLAIIEGMNIRVGNALYTIPITDITQSFRPKQKEIIRDPDLNEMLMVRGNVYPVVRLHELFGVAPDTCDLKNGITIMVESGENVFCIFADELLGQQEVVVKALPDYIKKTKGLAGCTLLGNGQISLILDTGNLAQMQAARA